MGCTTPILITYQYATSTSSDNIKSDDGNNKHLNALRSIYEACESGDKEALRKVEVGISAEEFAAKQRAFEAARVKPND